LRACEFLGARLNLLFDDLVGAAIYAGIRTTGIGRKPGV
jgi:hypothetical protein